VGTCGGGNYQADRLRGGDMAACGGSAGDPETNRKRAEEMVALAPTIIVAFGSSAVAAFLQATRSVPVVFAGVIDPVSAGYVAGLGAARWQRYRLFVV